jgi:hypothetical protein
LPRPKFLNKRLAKKSTIFEAYDTKTKLIYANIARRTEKEEFKVKEKFLELRVQE